MLSRLETPASRCPAPFVFACSRFFYSKSPARSCLNRLLLLLLALLLLLSACAPAPAETATPSPLPPTLTSTATDTPTPTRPTPTSTGTPIPTNLPPTATLTPPGPTPTLPLVAFLDCLPIDRGLRQSGVVTSVLDAATIDVRLEDGRLVTVRYIGVDAPAVDTPAGRQSVAYHRSLVADQPVTLIPDAVDQDDQGRLLRYVLTDDSFVNAALIEAGYAHAVDQLPNDACLPLFRRSEVLAFEAFRGLWGSKLAFTLTGTPTISVEDTGHQSANYGRLTIPTNTPGTPTPRCDPAYPTVCIPPPPPYLNCGDIIFRNFTVLFPDPHDLEGRDRNGIGCEKP